MVVPCRGVHASNPEDLCLIPGSYMLDKDNQLPQEAL